MDRRGNERRHDSDNGVRRARPGLPARRTRPGCDRGHGRGPAARSCCPGLGADVLKGEPVRGDGMRARRMGPECGSIPFDLAHSDKQSLVVDTESRAVARLRWQEVADAVVTTVAAQRQAHQRP
ncbi:CoA transferase [Streptomyces sp. NPDC002172]